MTSTTGTTGTAVDPAADPAPAALRGLCGGAVHLPGEPGYDAARSAWNLAVDQRPAAVAYPATTAEVADVVRAAAAAGLRVAPQGTGHNAGPLGALDGVVLMRTDALTGVTVDPVRQRATVGAGVLWLEVVEEAARHGVTVLHGSSPDVGVVGYSLGGGMGWYARALGLQTHAITAAEVVTADGSVLDVDDHHRPDLLWALRGGGGNVGIVTRLEFRTFPFTTAFAGMLLWDLTRADEIVRTWARWSATAPDTVTTAMRLLQVPPLPSLPDWVCGRQLVVVDGAVLADDEAAAEVLAPLRALEPEVDTFARVPTAALVRLHMDPEEPTPALSTTAILDDLPDAAVDALLAAAGPGSGSALAAVELRQLGGALARPAPVPAALPCLDGAYVLFCGGIPLSPELVAAAHQGFDAVRSALAPWTSGRSYLNFVETAGDPSTGFRAADWARLREVRAAVDPDGLFVANHPVPTD
jgi:FAD/FMN-containing dehydrogenase